MKARRLALAELTRLTSGKLLRLALAAMLLIPTLYAGLYLYANKDPYAKLAEIPAAIVVEDTPTTLANGEKLQAGDEVAKQLVDSKTFDWHEVSRAQAVSGMENEDYDFAIIVPKDFSTKLASATSDHPQQATLELLNNDTNGYIARTISNNVVAQVTKAVATKVSSTAASQMLLGFTEIHTNIAKAADGSAQLVTGLDQLQTGAGDLSNGATALATGQRKLLTGATQLSDGIDSASSGAAQLGSGARQLNDGLATLDSKTAALPAQTRQLADGAAQVAAGNRQLATGATSASSGAAQLQAGAARLHDGATQVAAGAHKVADGNAKVAKAGDLANEAAQQLAYVRNANRDRVIAQLQALAGDQALTADQRQQLETVITAAQGLDDRLNTADGKITQAAGSLDQLASGSEQVATGADKLVSGSQTLTSELGKLSTGTAKLASGATKAAAGADAVSAGASKLATGSAQLHSGIAAAHAGSARLAGGATTLENGLGRLSTGAHQLVDGERSAVTGADKLAAGAKTLGDGAGQALSGATQLRDGLRKGLSQIPNPSQQAREAAAQMIGNPVAVTNDNQAAASNYGAGMAPFFGALSLWIGAYVLFLLVRPLSNRALAAQQPAWRVALSGWMTPALLAVGQSVLVFLLAIKAQGFGVQHPLAMIAFMAFVSMTYVAILHALVSRFGAVGKFLGLVLMVVQLVSAGGTFPWQTLPAPLQALHRVLPMSYAIDGLRHLMYGGRMSLLALDIGVLALFLAAALVVSGLSAHRARIWTPARVKPDLSL